MRANLYNLKAILTSVLYVSFVDGVWAQADGTKEWRWGPIDTLRPVAPPLKRTLRGGYTQPARSGHGLGLMSINDVSNLPNSGNGLVVVARDTTTGDPYFRIFDRAGKRVVGKPEADVGNKSNEISALKQYLAPLWRNPEVNAQQTGHILDLVTSITGHPPRIDWPAPTVSRPAPSYRPPLETDSTPEVPRSTPPSEKSSIHK